MPTKLRYHTLSVNYLYIYFIQPAKTGIPSWHAPRTDISIEILAINPCCADSRLLCMNETIVATPPGRPAALHAASPTVGNECWLPSQPTKPHSTIGCRTRGSSEEAFKREVRIVPFHLPALTLSIDITGGSRV